MDGFSQRVYDVFSPVAIVGVGALFPEAKNADEYWSNIVKGKDCLKDVPETHWKISDYYDPNPSTPDKTYARRGGFIPETAFNPVEFGLPPSQLDVTDILQILSLSVAKQTFLDAGYEHAKLNREKTGVVLGITGANSLVTPLTSRLQYPLWQKVLESRGLPKAQVDDIVETLKLAYAPWEENSFPGMLGNVVAGRIANRFDLGGINCTVDAACASSLAAMRMAIDELHSGRADMMLTGGCDAENTILMYMCFSKTPAFSKKGVISPFDENSDGTLIGEGIGMMLLKRLEDAERDGDQVYAVIKGLGSASDGKFKSIYAPRAAGQVKALQRAYQQAGISPHDVDLWEAHGTGTAVGDATEVDGLKTFLKSWDNDGSSSPIALGSVKSQIGHTKAAAGAASAIKAALALQHGVLPPTINVNRPDPKLGLDETALYLNSTARPWFRDPKTAKRRVGVSAFGFGGTNFHLVLEEAPQTAKAPKLRSVLPRPIVVAAPTVAALRKRCEELLTATGEGAWPFEVSIPANHPRLGLVAADDVSRRALLSEAIQLLDSRPATAEWRHPKGITFRPSAFENAKLAGLFAGQGSQHPNMGRMAAVAIPALGDFVGAADTLFVKDGAQPLSQVMYPIPAFDDADRKAQEQALRRTQYAQTAIGALSAGHYRWLQNLGLKLEAVAGHSFGELTALWASGALSDADFSSLAKARGDAMAAVTGDGAGTMTAVKAGREQLESLIAATKGSVHFCNLNTPKQTVVGGAVEAIEKFEADLKAASIDFVRLNVAGAFHTPQVEGAVTAFAERIDQTSFAVPQIPVYANRNGKPYAASAADVAAQLKGQLREPVEFIKIIEQMYADGIRVFIEFGPRSTLSKMTADILGDRPHLAIALDHGQPDKADAGLIEAVVDLAVAGIALESPVGTEGLIEAPAKKGEINLNGMNYVSPSRKEAFAKALANPVVVAPKPVPTPPQPVAAKPLAAGPAPVRSEPVKPAAANVAFGVPAPSPAPSMKAASVEKPSEPLAPKQAVALTAPASRSSFAEKSMSILKNESSSEPAVALGGGDIVAELARSNGELHREYLKFEQSALQALVHNASELSAAHVDMLCEIHEETNLTHREFMRSLPSLFLGQGELPAARVRTVEHEPARHEPVKRMIETAVAHAAPVAAAKPAVTAKAFEPVATPVQPPAAKPVSVAPPAPVVAKPVAAPVAQAAAPAAASAAPAAVVRDTLLAVVSEKTGYPAEVIDLDMDLEADLGIDSIKRVEILGSLKERLPQMAELSPDRMGELRTLAQILELAGSASPALQASATPAAQHAAASIVAPTPAAFAPAVAAGAIRETLLAVVSEKTGYPADVIDLEMDLEADLGIDSIKRVEILGSLKERLPQMAELSPDRMGELRTLAQILELAGSVAPAPVAQPAAISIATPVSAATSPAVAAGAVREALLSVVSEKTGYPADVIDLDMDLEADLGIDSIKRVEILGSLKERLPQMAELSPDRMGELRTLAQILALATEGAVADAPAVSAAAPVPATVAVPALAPTQTVVPETAGLPAGAVREALLAVVSEKTGYPTDVIDLDMDLEADLGIDSIKRVEILGALKERLPQMAELSPDRMGELRTLAQILTLAEGEASNAGEPQQKEAALASFKDGDDLIGRGVVTLLPAPLDLVTQQAFQKGAKFLLTGTDDALILALQKGLKSKGIEAVWLRFEGKVSSKAGPQLAAGKDEAELKQQFEAQGPWDGVIYVHPKTIDNALPGAESDASVLWLKRVLLLAKLSITPLTARASQGRTVFMTLSRMDGALGYRDGSLATVASGALSGLVKTYAAEAPHIFARAVDIAPQIEDGAAADLLVQEVFDARHSITEIGLDGQGRWKPSIEAISSSDAVTVADPDELFIVTGGARGVTADCVLALASAAPRRFLLLGRSALEAEPSWAAGLETDAQLKGGALAALREGKAPVTPKLIDQTVRGVLAGREIRQLLAALEKLGSHASYLSLDISSPAISSLGDHPEIQKAAKISLVHGAGALADAAIAQKKISEMDRVFTPKIFGLAGLIKALTGKPFHRVLLFSSVAGLFGNPGQADYAMANEMLNRFAASQSVKGVDVRAINWGPWLGGMVTPEIRDIFMKRGVPIIPRDIGGQFFARETAMPLPATGAVLVGGLKPINARFVPFAELPQAPRRLALSGHDWTKSLLLADHQIKGRPVVPAAFVLGLVADGLESLLPGWTFSGFDQFNVLNGLVINKDWRGDFELSLSALRAETEETIRLDVMLADGSGRPRYKADNILLRKAAFMPPQPGKALPSLEPSTPANGFYSDGTLFHGESLQMLKTYRKLETASYLFRIAQPAAIHSAALNGFADSTLLDAVSVDAVLQAALAATRLEADSPSLPMRLGSATLTSRPEPGSDWLIAARLKASRAQELDWELTGYDLDGRLQMQLVATTVKRDEAPSGAQGSKSVEAVK
ncbi:beta-ketoacyl synthase N-terminal-like domain-containing protein [Agrobacterium vitis]